MSKSIRVLFEEFKDLPFPELGKSIGEFPLYDSLMAGTVCSFLDGDKVDLRAIPVPDERTAAILNVLMEKPRMEGQEAEFLKYAQLLDELREEITRAVSAG